MVSTGLDFENESKIKGPVQKPNKSIFSSKGVQHKNIIIQP